MNKKYLTAFTISIALTLTACGNIESDAKKAANLQCEIMNFKNNTGDNEAKDKLDQIKKELSEIQLKYAPTLENPKESMDFAVAVIKESANCKK